MEVYDIITYILIALCVAACLAGNALIKEIERKQKENELYTTYDEDTKSDKTS